MNLKVSGSVHFNKNLCVVPANQQKTDQTVISFLFLLGGVVVCGGVLCYVLHPHVSWPGDFYRDSLPTKRPTLLLTSTSWRALHSTPNAPLEKIFSVFLTAFVFHIQHEVIALISAWPTQRQRQKIFKGFERKDGTR